MPLTSKPVSVPTPVIPVYAPESLAEGATPLESWEAFKDVREEPSPAKEEAVTEPEVLRFAVSVILKEVPALLG